MSEDQEMNFPNVSGSNLDGQRFDLPKDMNGKVNIVIIAFRREQTELIEQWKDPLENLVMNDQSLRLYELPTLSVGYSPFRWWIDGGMRAGIPDEKARRRTITVYANKRSFKNQLGIPNEEAIYIFLVRKDGSVLAMVQGGYTNEKYEQLQKTISTNAQQRESD